MATEPGGQCNSENGACGLELTTAALVTRIRYSMGRNPVNHVVFEVLTPVVMKSTIFWDITLYRSLKVNHVSEEYVTSIFRAEK
jgi:hypothetical protein